MTIAITGATGQLGRLAVAALKDRVAADQIVALVRDPAKAADLGVAARAADYHDTDQLAEAVKGIDTLVLISSSDFNDRAGQHRNVIAAAKAAGVKHLIYTSILKGFDNPMILAGDHKATETAIAESGISATILRNGWYTENYTGALPASVEHGAIIGASGDGKIASAARKDYAEAIAVVATTEGHAGKTYELAGDTAYTIGEMAEEVSKVVGKTVPYQVLSQADYAAALTQIGLPEPVAQIFADSDARAGDSAALFDDSKTLSTLIGRPTTPMKETVAATFA